MRFLDPLLIKEAQTSRHGQVFKLKTKGADGQPLWAYRYRSKVGARSGGQRNVR